jgi:hypothetical protein
LDTGHWSVEGTDVFESLLSVMLLALPVRWVETSHADFADGSVDPEMYVSYRAQLESDSGCVEFFSRFDVDNNGYYDLACADDSGPNLRLYLGSSAGYSPSNCLTYPIRQGGGVELADLNLDGWAEMIHSGWRAGRVVIYWGTPGGPSQFDTTSLSYGGEGEDVYVYDLDKDGYLDILVGSSDGNLYIFWGTSSGYTSANRSQVNLGYSIGHNIEIGDFDRDGWGDLALSNWTYDSMPVVYWGPGRQPSRIIWLGGRWNNFHGLSVADLDKNGWLDLVYTGYDTVVTSYIYWGTRYGFSETNRTEIHPGQCYGGSAVVDWNYDGWLDVVYLRGNWINGGMWKPRVYYNTGLPPYFVDGGFDQLGNDTLNASGGFVADLNFDGALDIFVNNMVKNDSSYILWGPGHTQTTGLPVNNDHHAVFREPGNVYDRTPTAVYLSSVYDCGANQVVTNGNSSWISFEPPGSQVMLAYHSGDTPVPDETWRPFAQVLGNGQVIPDSGLGGRYLQYRITFKYDRPCYLPDVEQVATTFVSVTNTHDVGTVGITAPGSLHEGDTIAPQATVRNWGSFAETFPVIFRLGAAYADTTTVTGLLPDSQAIVRFAPWTAVLGSHAVSCSTMLAGDMNPSNDKATGNWVVAPRDFADVSVEQILAPVGIVDSGLVIPPAAVVRNRGSLPATFPVRFRIGIAYSDSTVVTLAVGASDTVAFTSWTAGPRGTWSVKCTVALANDTNPANNSQTTTVTVQVHDASAVQILAPRGSLRTGDSVVPQALVKNLGTVPQTFRAILRIGAGYSDTAVVTGLAPDSVRQVSFSLWTAPTGRFAVVCSTALVGDMNPANDKVTDSVQVAPPAVWDVAVEAILEPPALLDSNAVEIPTAVVRNLGTQPATFPVRFRIGGFYADEQSLTLVSNQQDTVQFAPWLALERGTSVVECTTLLDGDENPDNNALATAVTVRVRDVGATVILAPVGREHSDDSVFPQALVRNYGTLTETFMTEFRIGNTYADTQTVLGLAPDSEVQVSFAPWYSVIGGYAVSCSTMSGPDMNHGNDKVSDSIFVVMTSLLVQPDTAGSVLPSASVAYRLRVRNRGNQPDTIDLYTSHTRPDWSAVLLDSAGRNVLGDLNHNGLPDIGELAPGATCWITVRLTAPGTALAGTEDTTIVTGRSGLDPSMTDDARVRTRVLAVTGIRISPDVYGLVDPGDHLDYELLVQNLGNIRDLVDLELRRISARTGWTYQLLDANDAPLGDQNHNGRPDIGPLEPLTGSVSVLLRVTAPASAWAGDIDTAELWAASSVNPGMQSSIQARTEVRARLTVLLVDPDQTDNQTVGTTRDYSFYVQTAGNQNDTVMLQARVSRSDWGVRVFGPDEITPLPDADRDGRSELGPVRPGVQKPFSLKVTAPDSFSGGLSGSVDSLGKCYVTVFGQSARNPGLTDTATLIIQMVPGLAIHNYENPFREHTRFVFSMPRKGKLQLVVYDRNGQTVRRLIEHETYEPGIYTLPWDGLNDFHRRVAPGTYLYVYEMTDSKDHVERVFKKLTITGQ